MSEMGEDFNEWRKVKQAKKADNRQASAELLAQHGVRFESKNGGAHLIVLAGSRTYDFWPGTGLWRIRNGVQSHRGVRKLLAQVKQLESPAQ